MAIKVIRLEGGKIQIDMDNGHVKALDKITASYGIKATEDSLGFMLALLADANGAPIEVGGKSFVPSDSIKNTNHFQTVR